jgi:6,7-dimethyl-8-ribityllumazine synthase
VKAVLKVCGNIHSDDLIEKTVSEDFLIPMTAKFLAMSEYVDVIIIINPRSHHLTTNTDATSVAVMHGIMDIGLHANVPIVFGTYSSSSPYDSNTYFKSSYEVGKTALKMALMRWDALALVAYEQEGSGVGYIGALTIFLFLFILFGIIVKNRGIITSKKAIFAKIMYCRKEYDKVEDTETLAATLA